MSGKLGRLFLLIGFAIMLLLFAWEVFAEESQVIEVRRNIPLSDKDPVFKDFYINSGSESGLKKNLVVTALRKVNIKDARGTMAYGEILIPVGQLKIIFVQNRLSVAREYKLLNRNEYPMLEQTGIMSGDLIESKGGFVDNRKSSDTNASKEEESTNVTPTSVAEAELVQKIENAQKIENIEKNDTQVPLAAAEQTAAAPSTESTNENKRVAEKPE